MAVEGTYKVMIKTPMGAKKSTIILELIGATLSGSVDGPGGLSEFTDGTVNGNEAKWAASGKTPFGMMKFEFTAVVDGDKISGVAKARMGSSKFEGTRA